MLDNYKKTVVTVTVPRFGCRTWAEFLAKLASGAEKDESALDYVPRKRWERAPDKVCLVYSFDYYQREYGVTTFIKSLNQVFNPEFLSYTIREENEFKSNWELYEHLLKNHDWTYAYSDDHRVWCSGEAARKRINQLKEMLSTENMDKAEKLFKKYYQ